MGKGMRSQILEKILRNHGNVAGTEKNKARGEEQHELFRNNQNTHMKSEKMSLATESCRGRWRGSV